MKRWLILPAALLAACAATAQITREAPLDVRPGRMAVATPPDIVINGKPERLSPGARIRDTRNMLVLSGSLSGQTVPVVFRRDGAGQVHEVWLLTADEFVLRSGHQVIARIDPRDVQRCIPRRRFDRTEAGVDDDTLFLPGPDGTVLDLVLAQPIEVLLPAFLEHRRRRAHVQRIALHVDDPAAARAALTPVSARSRGSSRR